MHWLGGHLNVPNLRLSLLVSIISRFSGYLNVARLGLLVLGVSGLLYITRLFSHIAWSLFGDSIALINVTGFWTVCTTRFGVISLPRCFTLAYTRLG